MPGTRTNSITVGKAFCSTRKIAKPIDKKVTISEAVIPIITSDFSVGSRLEFLFLTAVFM
jgi:hypothetical protein